MSLQDVFGFVGVALLVLAGGLVAAADLAIAEVSASKIEGLADDGSKRAARLLKVLDRRPVAHDLLVLLRIVATQGAAVLLACLVMRWIGSVWLWLVIPAFSLFTFAASAVLRRALLLRGVDKMALTSARFVLVARRALTPLLRFLTLPATSIGGPEEAEAPTVDVREILDHASGGEGIEEEEARMLHSVITFTDTIVRDVMAARPDMVCLAVGTTVDAALRAAADSGFSRLPVYGDGLDDMLGLLYVKDLIVRSPGAEDGSIRDFLRPAKFVPEQKRTTDLLADMRAEKFHLAIVVDEYGGTAGLVTLEDLLEELVGEIEDEYDPDEELISEHGDGRYRVVGRFPLGDLEDELGIRIDVEDATTVGGAMLSLMGRIPEPGEVVEHPTTPVKFQAVRVSGHRILEVALDVFEPADDDAAVDAGTRDDDSAGTRHGDAATDSRAPNQRDTQRSRA